MKNSRARFCLLFNILSANALREKEHFLHGITTNFIRLIKIIHATQNIYCFRNRTAVRAMCMQNRNREI